MSGPPPPSGAVRRFVGYALITVGWLIVALAGLCTGISLLVFISGVLAGPKPVTADLIAAALFPVIIGGGPIVVGVMLIFIGRVVVRRR